MIELGVEATLNLNNFKKINKMTMSNKVHIARISKSGVEVARRYGTASRVLTSADVGPEDNEDYVFGSISPRGGVSCNTPHNTQQQLTDSPDHTQRDTTESDNNISSCSTLDIVNKVEYLPVHQLELQVRELTQRLKQTEEQRCALQRQLEESNEEKEVCHRRLEVVSSAHECRITEMHCVIAELSKKLRSKQEHIIMEEQEPEGSEISYQEGSIFNSEINLTNPDVESQTEPIDGLCIEYSAGDNTVNSTDKVRLDEEDLKHIDDSINKGQVEALKEEVLHLRAQISLLQAEIANSLHSAKPQDKSIVEQQHELYFTEDLEANESIYSLEHQLCMAHTEVYSLNDLNMSAHDDFSKPYETITSPQKQVPAVAKMAERVKLRCVSKVGVDDVTSMDLLKKGLGNVNVVEHLVSDLKENNCMLQSFTESSQVDNELQRLQRKVEHLKVRNKLLSLSLDECKEHTEQIYLLCGKYESNAVALQLALNCSDRAIEAYDVMLALLESKLALINDKTLAAEDSRKAVESVARHLLDRLESEKNVCENSLGPWQNTFSIPDTSKTQCIPWTSDDDNRLRYHVSKLKGRRSAVQNTTVKLESPFSDLHEKKRVEIEDEKDFGQEKREQNDLEMAVLMQELLNLRDENSHLKSKFEEAEQEYQHANDRISILQVQMQLAAESNALFHQQQVQENRISYSEAEHAALIEQQLIEALTRETELKGRIQSLIASVSATQKMSDEKYGQLHQNVRELQKSNHNLGQMLDQNKRKYQQRVRKLEQKIDELKLDCEHYSGGGTTRIESVMHKSVAKSSLHPHFQQEHVPETTL